MYIDGKMTCKSGLQLFTLVRDDIVCGRDECTAGTVNADLESEIPL